MTASNLNRPGRVERDRLIVLAALCVTIVAGLASRKFPWLFPTVLADYPGDAFWAMAAYLGVIMIRPGIGVPAAAAAAATISFGVELSQLYHAGWIDAIRRTLFGRLILGSGFDRIDLLAYLAGILAGMIADRWIIEWSGSERKRNGQ